MKIILLKQNHSYRGLDRHLSITEDGRIYTNYQAQIETYEPFINIVKSQLKIAQFIEENPNYIVISENHSAHNLSSISEKEIKLINKSFPNGFLSSSFESLNFEQRAAILLMGSTNSCIIKGIIPKSYSDHDELVHFKSEFEDVYLRQPILEYNFNLKRSIKKYDSENEYKKRYLNQMREYLALQNAQEVSKQENKDVILVYGRNHEFSDILECSKDIELIVHDMGFDFTDPIERQDYNEFLQLNNIQRRPLINCTNLALGTQLHIPSFTPSSLPSNPTSIPEMPLNDNNSFTNYATGTAALAVLATVGLFKCCAGKRNKKNHTPQIEQTNELHEDISTKAKMD